jgi:hypothetical protein
MTTKSQLLSALQQVQDEVIRFADRLSESDRNVSGTPDNWGPRDILAHIGQTQHHMASDLAIARGGGTPPQGDLPERSNAATYQVFSSRTWSDIYQIVQDGHKELTEQMQSYTDAELNDPNLYSWMNGAPIWRRAAGLGVVHTTVHLAQYAIASGDRETGRRMADLERDLSLALDSSDRWVAMIHYNQGCYHALLGEKEPALQELETSFRLSSQFIEFSQQDTDLVSLHEDPDFLDLHARVKPVA